MFAALRVRDFRLLWAGGLVSTLGSWLLVVAVPYQAYRLTGSISATGLTLAVESLPALVVGPVAGVLVDRWDHRRLMVATNLLCAVALTLMVAADRPDRLGWLYAGILAENVGAVLYRPAARAFTPTVIGTGPELAGANAANATARGVLRLVGPPLGTVLLTWWGFSALVTVDAASYVASALAVTAISAARRPAGSPGPGDVRGLSVLFDELRAGLAFVVRQPTLRAVLVLGTAFFTANAVFTTLLVPFVGSRFGPGPDAVGALLSALGGGYLLGGPLAGWLVRRHGPGVLLFAAQVGIAVCFAGLALAPDLGVALLALGLAGPPGALLLVSIETTIQVASPAVLRGRVGATFFAADAGAELMGALLATTLGAAGRLVPVLTGTACAILAAALLGLFLLPARSPPG